MPDRRTLALQAFIAFGDARSKPALPPKDTAVVPVWRIGPTHTPASTVDEWVERGWCEIWRSGGRCALTLTEKGREAIKERTT